MIFNYLLLDGSEIYFMPDSLMSARRGIGTRPVNARIESNEMNNNFPNIDKNALIPPSNSNQNNSSHRAIDFSARPGATIKGNKNKSNFTIYF